MPDLQLLQRQKAEKLEKMRSIIKKADDEKHALTDAEIAEFNGIDVEVKSINTGIEREQRILTLETDMRFNPQIPYDNNSSAAGQTAHGGAGQMREASGFENIGEFFACIAVNRNDPRLLKFQYRAAGTPENRTTMIKGTGSLGGFTVPTQFAPGVMGVQPQASIIRPGAMVIPAGDVPDAKYEVTTLDQTAAQNMYGGITIYHGGEAVAITESNMNLKRVTLEPKALKGYLRISNELMNNWAAASVFIQRQIDMARVGAEDYDFFRGNGVNRALGILNCPCRVNYTRAGANGVTYADVVGMFARAKLGGNLVWLASQTTIPQLANIRDTGNNNLWIQNSALGIPSRMLGFEVIFNERSPALGTAGDLALVDRSYYLVKDGSGPRVDVSTEFLFSTDETCFRIAWNVDGTGWLSEPIPLEGSTSDTVSPFVVLN